MSGDCKHRPHEARTSLFEARSAVNWGRAREPLSLPLCCIHVPKNMEAFSTMESWNSASCPVSSKSLVILPSKDILSTGFCLNREVKTLFPAHDLQMAVSYRGKKSEGRSQFPSPYLCFHKNSTHLKNIEAAHRKVKQPFCKHYI